MVKLEYPYIDANGIAHPDLIKFYTDQVDMVLIQLPGGKIFGNEVIDSYPTNNIYREIAK